MKVSGFTILRDGERLGYPFVESIQSVLPLVDEFVIALGACTDRTPDLLRAIDSPKLKIIDTVWDDSLVERGQVLSVETNKALERCTGDWCFYLQGDEVIHEQDHDRIDAAMRRHLPGGRVLALSFDYYHFRGSFDLLDPIPYRRQVRIIRNHRGLVSIGDACGFGLPDPNAKRGYRKIRSRSWCSRNVGAKVYHYGWVRPPRVMNQKFTEFERLYTGDQRHGIRQAEHEVADDYQYNVEQCQPFTGTHPAVMRERVEQYDWVVPFKHVPLWRNAAWWNGFLQKNSGGLYRKAG